MKTGGWIRVPRSIFDAPFSDSDELLALYIRLASKVNYQQGVFKNHVIEPGEFAYATRTIRERLYGKDKGPSKNTILERLRLLRDLGAITKEVHPSKRFSVISLVDTPKRVTERVPNFGTPTGTPTGTLTGADRRRGEKGKKGAVDFLESVLIPESLNLPEFLEAWHEWIAYRHSKRKPVSELAAKRLLKQLESFGVDGAIASIHESIANDWQGLFEPRGSRPSGSGVAKPGGELNVKKPIMRGKPR